MGIPVLNADKPVLPERSEIVEAIRKIYDPEIPVNIFDLGLIYSIDVGKAGVVEVEMTLTAPACPVAGTLPGEVGRMIETVPGVSEAVVRLVWDPPWGQERMTEEARLELGLF